VEKTVVMNRMRILQNRIVGEGEEVTLHPDRANELVRTGQARPRADADAPADEPAPPPVPRVADARRDARKAVRLGTPNG
jgi:hypothetical protein